MNLLWFLVGCVKRCGYGLESSSTNQRLALSSLQNPRSRRVRQTSCYLSIWSRRFIHFIHIIHTIQIIHITYIIYTLACRYDMLYRVCVVQIQPQKPVLWSVLWVDHAGNTAPTRQQERHKPHHGNTKYKVYTRFPSGTCVGEWRKNEYKIYLPWKIYIMVCGKSWSVRCVAYLVFVTANQKTLQKKRWNILCSSDAFGGSSFLL